MKPIYHLNGKWFGFADENGIYNKRGEFVACVFWADEVYSKKGEYLGRLIQQKYVVRDLGLVGNEIPPYQDIGDVQEKIERKSPIPADIYPDIAPSNIAYYEDILNIWKEGSSTYGMIAPS